MVPRMESSPPLSPMNKNPGGFISPNSCLLSFSPVTKNSPCAISPFVNSVYRVFFDLPYFAFFLRPADYRLLPQVPVQTPDPNIFSKPRSPSLVDSPSRRRPSPPYFSKLAVH